MGRRGGGGSVQGGGWGHGVTEEEGEEGERERGGAEAHGEKD